MGQGTISFPGIVDPIRLRASRSQGMSPPGVAIVWAKPQVVTQVVGDLEFGFKGINTVWKDALCDATNVQWEMSANLQVFSIQDKRWKVQSHHVTSAFNVRRDDGTVDPDTQKTLAELVTWLFSQVSETVDVSAITSTEEPHVEWDRALFPDAVDDLLERRGYVATLAGDNTYKVYEIGVGASYTDGGDLMSLSNAVDPPELPFELAGVCAQTRVQSKLRCVPVGLDNDKSIQKLDDVSYKPLTWVNPDLVNFANIPSAEDRALALRSIGRWFLIDSQADGTLNIASNVDYAQGEIAVTSIKQVLPLRDKLVETVENPFGVEQFEDAYVEATYFDDYQNPPQGKNTPAFTRVEDVDWQILSDIGLVVLSDPVRVKNDDGTFTIPDLYLTCSYSVTDPAVHLKDRYERIATLGGVGRDVVELTALRRTLVCEYGTDHVTIVNIVDNKADVDTDADDLLTQAEKRYVTVAGYVAKYRGIKQFNVDGVTTQIKWDCAVAGEHPWATTVSLNMQGDPRLVQAGERRRRRDNRILTKGRLSKSDTP